MIGRVNKNHDLTRNFKLNNVCKLKAGTMQTLIQKCMSSYSNIS